MTDDPNKEDAKKEDQPTPEIKCVTAQEIHRLFQDDPEYQEYLRVMGKNARRIEDDPWL